MIKEIRKSMFIMLIALFSSSCNASDDLLNQPDSMIIDHNCTNISKVPVEYIKAAKQKLVIAYGHTSHGSQIISGMDGLDDFMTANGSDDGLFDFNGSGSNGALQLRDCPFSGADDLGNPDRSAWAAATRKYLNDHSDVNVIMWSWCGQVGWASKEEIEQYLSLMTALETDFPKVTFVYMTGHLDGSGKDGQLNIRNNQIREYCKANKKVLFDFADIESYDPDGKVNYMELSANDNCDYTTATGESKNWATDWQQSHKKNVDWYYCEPAHSQALNGNRKAYAAWWLFARLSGWEKSDSGSSSAAISNSKMKWSVVADCLKFEFEQAAKPSRLAIYNLNGEQLYSEAVELNADNSYSLQLSMLSDSERKNMMFFRIATSAGNYTGKFISNR